MRTVEQQYSRLQDLLPILACPMCGGPLEETGTELVSQRCGSRYPVVDGVPILLPPELVEQGLGCQLGADDNVSMHPYSEASSQIIEASGQGWVLDLGSGGKHIGYANVVQMDVFRFPMTDVVGSADCMPFKANVFRSVVSQAVFEHLQFPEAAASEVWRVLVPDGVAKIDTAFLQPEHAYPHHYFNATEAGLRHWFRDFELEWSGVEPYQHPKWSLVWFLSVYFASLPDEQRKVLEPVALGECVEVLSRLSRGVSTADDGPIIEALDGLVPDGVRTLAAGVSVRAVKRVSLEQVSRDALAREVGRSALVIGLERRIENLTRNKAASEDKDQAVSEMLKIAADRTRYLLQFFAAQHRDPWDTADYFNAVRGLTVRRIKQTLPDALWSVLRRVYRLLAPDSKQPLLVHPVPTCYAQLILVVHPKAVVPLLDMFFSLTHQSHANWALWICEKPDIAADTLRLAHALAALDDRVHVLSSGGSRPVLGASGKQWWVCLPNNCVMSFRAVRELVTLASVTANVQRITADIECWKDASQADLPIRCHTWEPDEHRVNVIPSIDVAIQGLVNVEPMVVYSANPGRESDISVSGEKQYAHLPLAVYRLVNFSAV